ncbi:Hypothetical predicted protein [Paramuricea clavata]|nr:Hypothetical predicted protein [Paramuricea clavata]
MNSTYYCPYDGESEEYRKVEKQKMKQRRNLELAITYGDLGRIVLGQWGSLIVNAALIITQFSFCVNYFIFMGDTITRMFPLADKNKTHTPTPVPNSTALLGESASDKHPGAPNVIFLMLIPFPFFLLQTYVRKVRSLGPLSAIANACVFLGFFSILGFILKGIDFSNVYKVDMWKFSTFPIFFGQIIGAYEGIGTIIPIEASMKENRKNFRNYLHGAILLLSIILGTFGIFGYIHFTDDVEQLISDNLPYGTLSIIVQITLCVGILFTYPLQIFPVVQIAENFLFKETKERSTFTASFNSEHASIHSGTPGLQYGNITPGDESSGDESSDTAEQNSANRSAEEMGSISKGGYSLLVRRPGGLCSCDMGWSTWKRNIVRTILVILSFGVAYVSRNYYAYIAAISGSIGSSLLAFILPCIFHLIIKRDTLPTYIVAKDILLIIFGIIAGIVGFVTTLIKIIK